MLIDPLQGGVVLADSQPLTDTQIQCTLLREMAGLSCTVLDADSEPCSPTRLLHNIERQVRWRVPPSLTVRRYWADWVSFLSAERSAQPDCQQPDVPARLFPAIQAARHLRSRQDGFREVVNAAGEFTASNINPTAVVRFAPCTLATPSRCFTVLFLNFAKDLVNC